MPSIHPAPPRCRYILSLITDCRNRATPLQVSQDITFHILFLTTADNGRLAVPPERRSFASPGQRPGPRGGEERSEKALCLCLRPYAQVPGEAVMYRQEFELVTFHKADKVVLVP